VPLAIAVRPNGHIYEGYSVKKFTGKCIKKAQTNLTHLFSNLAAAQIHLKVTDKLNNNTYFEIQ